MIYHVVAMARNRVIGRHNALPWHFSEDLKYFKRLTLGHTVIMGRKTYESIGKPLPGRENFVLSTKTMGGAEGIRYFTSVDQAMAQVQTEHAFIIGGAQVYASTLNRVDGVYLTRIDADFEGDAFYPELPAAFSGRCVELLKESPKIEAWFYEKRTR